MSSAKNIAKKATRLFEKGVSKTEVAKRLGVSRTTLYKETRGTRKKANDFSMIQNIELPFLYAYQRDFLSRIESHSRVFVLKARQIGFSHVLCVWAFCDIVKTARPKLFLSASQRQVKHLKQKLKKIVFEATGVELRGGEAIEVFLPKKRKSTFQFLSTNTNTVQGFSGDVLIDEAAWIPRFEDLTEALLPSRLLGGKAIFVSTPSTKEHPAYKLFLELEKEGSTMQVSLKDAINGGLETALSEEELRKELGNKAFLQFFECQWQESGNKESFFKAEDIAKVFFSEKELDEKGTLRTVFPDIVYSGGPCIFGVDPSGDGKDGDAFCIVVVESCERLCVVSHFSSSTVGFEGQIDTVLSYYAKYKPFRVCIDASFEGIFVAKKIQEKIGAQSNVQLFRFTPNLKQALVRNFAKLLAEKKIAISKNDIALQESILALRIVSSQRGEALYKTKRKHSKRGSEHGDLFWALSMAIFESDFSITKGVSFSCIRF